MVVHTLEDYIKMKKALKLKPVLCLNEEGNNEYEHYLLKQKMKHNMHDKLFREILNNKKDVVSLINEYIKPKEILKENDIEKYETKYITSQFLYKETDVVYKIKDKEVYFLIEHQSKIDYTMAYRITEYSMAIVGSKIKNGKQNKIPKVIPIVIYTGQAIWNAKTSLEEMQEIYEHEEGTDLIYSYNLIDIRNKEKAIQNKSFIAIISVLERMKEEEEIIKFVETIFNKTKNQEEKEKIIQIAKMIFEDKLDEQAFKEMENILIKKGGNFMLHAQQVIREADEKRRREAKAEGIKEGLEEGKKEGLKEGIFNVAKKLMQENLDINIIMKVTGLTREQILSKK